MRRFASEPHPFPMPDIPDRPWDPDEPDDE
jgi:hypothetical protein